VVLLGSAFAAEIPAKADAGPCNPAELFATDNTDPLFEIQANVTIALNGAAVRGSTPLDAAYWSNALQQTRLRQARIRPDLNQCNFRRHPTDLHDHIDAVALLWIRARRSRLGRSSGTLRSGSSRRGRAGLPRALGGQGFRPRIVHAADAG